ncbi:hypothetical protein L873DRAFT_1442024 [Choiromyces venosus 120613-1]|uniref:P-loop containing nucleoside triphosphate hydrolase protein n=1 Tax=Choiromyces venosus 120613-1 TaxID=1336337 RepID=A0A3N4JK77_9PEZI|nr:hypothetical protein L873DRAFT_1442024 [Choiromyces venosus 120613-1]
MSSSSEGEIITDGGFQKETVGGEGVNPKQSWWRKKRQFNPLRWGPTPPIPAHQPASKEPDAGFFSQVTFAWMGSLMRVGYSRPLETNDIPLVAPNRGSQVLTDKLQASFDKRRNRGDQHPLLWSLNEVFFREFWLGGLCRLSADCLLIFAPFVLKYLIRFSVEAYIASKRGTPGPPVGRGIGLAFGLALMQIFGSLFVNQFMYRGMIVGGQARAGLIGMIFSKSLRISGRARAGGTSSRNNMNDAEATPEQKKKDKKKDKKNKDEGEGAGWSNGRVVNLMGTDSYRVDQAASWFHIIWTSAFQIILSLILLLINISYSALAGFALLILGVPVLSWVVKILAARRRAMNQVTDKRVGLTQEILLGVRLVKFFGWEKSFLQRLEVLRNKEIGAIQFLLGVRAGINAVGMSLPVFASMLAFITYSLTDNRLDPASIFSSLALFNVLRLPLNLLPVVIAQTIDAWVSIQRMQEYLLAEELEDETLIDENPDYAVEISDAGFTWEKVQAEEKHNMDKTKAEVKKEKRQQKQSKKDEAARERNGEPEAGSISTATTEEQPFSLKEINLQVGHQELIAIVGSVGSGKSSLLAALAGDMRKTSGNIKRGPRVAYCPQYAWIQNASVRENIIFGREFKEDWYADVVDACALQQDLDMLPHGDQTEIGERGITVSGGQKQRLNIARAIYFDADIVLMDDPLSAVDAHVGRHLFDKAICGLLKDKCRILATHQLHVINKVDRVVWMEEGQIEAVGTFNELMQTNVEFARMMGEIATESKEGEKKSLADDEIEEEAAEKPKGNNSGGKGNGEQVKALMQAEERAIKSVPWNVYKAYIKASGSYLVAPGVIFLLILSQACNIITTLWLSWWISDRFGLSRGTYIGIFAALGVSQSVLLFAFSFALTIAGTKSSKVLMHGAMQSTLRAPMSFFDTTPIGRIVNRFSKDVDVMDNNLTDAMRMYFLTLTIILSVFILIIVYFHYFAIALVPLAIGFIFAASYYRASAREVKRHESVLRSVVFAKFGEALSGTACIRAYALQDRFVAEIHKAIDGMDSAYFITFANQRWLSLRLDVIGNLLVFTTAILVVTSRFSVNPSIGGVVLSYILQIVMLLQWMIRQLAEVENAMNATERIYFYGNSLPSEAELHKGAIRPSWPEHGEITMHNVEMRYRDGLPLVLKGFSMHVNGGERIGIVGRTGAGKSSIMSGLFRLVELSGGSIEIDGVDISKIGLHDLRSKLAIIPQDPTLFRGTVRSNLDPFGKHTDEELWGALRQANLVEDAPADGAVASGRITLDGVVDEEGTNFSLGQRQLMALARALVRGSRIIVCDEATSSVDIETDRKIQRAIVKGFEGRTLLCIAHRLRYL